MLMSHHMINGKRKPCTVSSRGTALVIVLWTIAFLSVVSLSFSKTMGLESRFTRNMLSVAQDRYHAEAGLNRAVLSLLQANAASRWIADGSVKQIQHNDAIVHVSVLDERARIDLNYASPALLQGLLATTGLDQSK